MINASAHALFVTALWVTVFSHGDSRRDSLSAKCFTLRWASVEEEEVDQPSWNVEELKQNNQGEWKEDKRESGEKNKEREEVQPAIKII